MPSVPSLAKPAFGLLLCLLACSAPARADSVPGVHHYVFFNRDRERMAEASFLNAKGVEGAQIKYTWRQLEQGKDHYEFGDIQHDLDFLTSKGKKLFIQIQDVSFDPTIVPIPRYLLSDPQYHGGADKQYNITGDDEAHATPAGWVARRWDPAVRDRFHLLLAALGRQFDGKIEGVNLPETAVDFGDGGRLFPEGFTAAAYHDAVIANMAALKRAFPKSVAMQYANFMPEEKQERQEKQEKGDADHAYLRSVYRKAAELNVALGGPDLLPHKPGQMANSYPLLREYAGRVPTGIAVQDGNYEHTDPETHRRVTARDLLAFGTDYLRVRYIFWCTQEPYYTRDVLPLLRGQRDATPSIAPEK